MNRLVELGMWYGLRITAGTSVFLGIIVLWIVIAAGAAVLLDIPAGEAIAGGFLGAIFHILGELVHQFGHAFAARRTGYPMQGVRLWFVLGLSIYPKDEPPLLGSIHIRRALGGPIGSGLFTIVLAVLALLLRPWDQTPGWIAAFVALDNLLVFTLGALLPLGFTDGSTLLRWWGK